MSIKKIVVPLIAAAGMGVGLVVAPTASAVDPCRSAVSSSRCLGPSGIDGFDPSGPSAGVRNGPYGSWGFVPPLG